MELNWFEFMCILLAGNLIVWFFISFYNELQIPKEGEQ